MFPNDSIFPTPSSWFLLLLLLVPAIGWLMWKSRRRAAVVFSGTRWLSELPPTWRQRLRWIPAALTVAAMVLLIIALARPQEGRKQTIVESEGIAIELVVDRSGSMQAMDFTIDDQPVDRLTAVKDVASTFITGDQDLEGRVSDVVGLVAFAGHADSETPLTLDHPYLIAALSKTEIAAQRSEDGTAIGDALGLAVEKLTDLERGERKIKSKVVILLTDGENNAGDLEPTQAAELAAAMGIKVYTIGVGTKGRAPVPVVDAFGRRSFQWTDVNIDEDTLKQVAQTTGGKYFRATDTDSLKKIYAEIDELEKSHVEAKHYTEYRELAIEPLQAGRWWLPPLVMLALVAYAGQAVLKQTVFRQPLN